MIFDSFSFLFRFLPVFLVIYYLTPGKYRNYILFAGSLLFYTLGQAEYLPLLLASVILHYTAGRVLEAKREREGFRRAVLVLTLLYDFGVLFFFKYSGQAVRLPMGISFYTFQITAYLIDVYRGRIAAEHSIWRLGTYLTMFSQIQSGPIVLYQEMETALRERSTQAGQLESGLRLLILGLGAKVVIADRIGILWRDIATIGYESISTPLAWMGAFAYSLQLYFDFAGYSMMAMGIGTMLGFEIPQNFRLPYRSGSVTEFWRRWHITLGRWFREYVYIPLGGNRKGKSRTLFNLLVVWTLTALWHGAQPHFLIWGASLLILMMAEKLWYLPFLEKHRALGQIYVLAVVPLTWVAFAIPDTAQLGIYFQRLFPFPGGVTGSGGAAGFEDAVKYVQTCWPVFLTGVLFASGLPAAWYEKIRERWTGSLAVAGVLAVSMYYLSISVRNPFLYFSF